MALSRIEEIFIYTDSLNDPIGTQEIHAWFDHSAIPHIKLNYNNAEQTQIVLDAVNTWWNYVDIDTLEEVNLPPVTAFPFVVYTEVHSNGPISYLPRKYIQGKDNIIAKLPGLYSLGRD